MSLILCVLFRLIIDMNTIIKWGIIILSICATLAIIFVCAVYGRNDFCLAWNVAIDNDATLSFVGVLGVILTPVVTIITAMLYYSSLLEQRKQNFDNKWQSMLETQLHIRDTQKIHFEWIDNNWEKTHITMKGYRCIIMATMLYRNLTQAIRNKQDYTDRDYLMSIYDESEQILFDYDEVYRVEQEHLRYYNPKEYKKQQDKACYERKVAMIGHLFSIMGDESGNANLLAFELIYKKYFWQSSTYFTHTMSLLRFLDRQVAYYSEEEIQECAKHLSDNLTYCEKELLLQYAEYQPNNKKIINQYIKL